MTTPTHPQVHIRRIRPDDELDPVVDLFDRYRQFYGHEPDRDRCRDYLRARLERAQSVILAAIAPGGQTVGFVQLYPTYSSLALAPVWTLNDLYVATSARRQGIAGRLMDHAEALAADAGAAAVILETATTNHPAVALYRTRGYTPETDFDHYTLDLR